VATTCQSDGQHGAGAMIGILVLATVLDLGWTRIRDRRNAERT